MTALTGRTVSRFSAGHWIGAAASSAPDAPCLVESTGLTRSFGEVDDRANRLARAMSSHGLRPGDRLAIVATDSAEHVEVVLACLITGVVWCDLNFRLRPAELATIVGAAGPKWIVAEPRYRALADHLAGGVTPAATVVTLGGRDLEPSIAGLIGAEPDGSPLDVVPHGEDIVSIAFTSGTTGTPKGVLQSERMLRSMVYSCISEARVRARSFRYNGPPLFHLAGIGAVLYGIAVGATTLLLPQFDAGTVVDWMQRGGLTDVLLVPTMLSAILDHPATTEATFPALRSVLYGGGPMTPALLRRVIDTFGAVDLFNLFGAGTEAGGQATLYPEDHAAALAGRPELLESIGRVIPGVQVRLVDAELSDVPRGEFGEMLVRTETSMSGYLDQPELTARTVVDGWIRTGDIARMDADGYLFLAARRSEVIVRGGENVYPSEIEGVIAERPDVAAVAVVGRHDAHWGEIVVAVVSPRDPSGTVDTAAARELCATRLAAYKVPTEFVVVGALPLTASGKIARPAVRDLAERLLRGESVDISDDR